MGVKALLHGQNLDRFVTQMIYSQESSHVERLWDVVAQGNAQCPWHLY
jgi:hypothetical protein